MDELAELQKEFRLSVLSSLSELKDGQKEIERDLQTVKVGMTTKDELKTINSRLAALEQTKTQLITAFVVIQGIVLASWTAVSHYWSKQ